MADGVEQVLLGLKKTGFGLGRVVGIGGHLEPGETPLEAVCREVAEETALVVKPEHMHFVGTVDFVFPARPEWDMFSSVFLCWNFTGDAAETAEIQPQWHPVDQLPLKDMWDDAAHWLPAFLAGQRGAWRVELNPDNKTVAACTWQAPTFGGP